MHAYLIYDLYSACFRSFMDISLYDAFYRPGDAYRWANISSTFDLEQ